MKSLSPFFPPLPRGNCFCVFCMYPYHSIFGLIYLGLLLKFLAEFSFMNILYPKAGVSSSRLLHLENSYSSFRTQSKNHYLFEVLPQTLKQINGEFLSTSIAFSTCLCYTPSLARFICFPNYETLRDKNMSYLSLHSQV